MEISPIKNQLIILSQSLMGWHFSKNNRVMPWKGEADVYKIWLSEVILQQTRVEQGLSYYERFVSSYPTVSDLATAPDGEVYKLWEGLGYYNRCKNLLHTARYVHYSLNGHFPSNYEVLLQLKGIGPYTAAAIASFAFGEKKAVVDGNVLRVLSRALGSYEPIDKPTGRKLITMWANEMMDGHDPAQYNQAIMDFGATVCKPAIPDCFNCPLQANCYAFKHNKTVELPVKGKSAVKKKRYFYYFVCQKGDAIFLRQRTSGDIWQNLHEFFLIETQAPVDCSNENLSQMLRGFGIVAFKLIDVSITYSQILTHQIIVGTFIKIEIDENVEALKNYILTNKDSLIKFAFPRLIVRYLADEKQGS